MSPRERFVIVYFLTWVLLHLLQEIGYGEAVIIYYGVFCCRTLLYQVAVKR